MSEQRKERIAVNREKKENHDKLLKTKRINGERKKEKRETKRKIKRVLEIGEGPRISKNTKKVKKDKRNQYKKRKGKER